MARINLTEGQIYKALEEALKTEGEDGVTPSEATQMLHSAGYRVDIRRVRQIFRDLIEAGRAEVVEVVRTRWDGEKFHRSGIRPK